MSEQANERAGAMFAALVEAQRRTTERMQTGTVEELLHDVGLDDLALRTWAQHVERNATPESTIAAAFCGGVLIALELVAMRSQ